MHVHLRNLAKGSGKAFFDPGLPKLGAIGYQDSWQLTVNIPGDELHASAGLARRYTVDWTTSGTSFASGPLPLDETPPLLVMSPPEKSAATRRLRQAGNSRLEEVQFVTAKLLRSIQLSQLNHNAESGFGGNFS